jgi:hypothetical protein
MPTPWSSGRSFRRPRALALTAVALAAVAAVAIAPAQAASLFSDGFESGTMSAWSTVKSAAGGVVGVQTQTVHSGAQAAQLSETGTSGSLAYARTQLSGDQNDLTATGAFMVTTEGAANANVPIFRFLDATGARAVSLYRQNQSGNHLWVKVGNGSAAMTSGLLPLSTWGVLALHTIVAGSTSTVSVTLNGASIYSTAAATLTSPMRTVQIGNDTAAQAFGIVVDDVQLDSAGTGGDTTAPDTTITGGPTGTVTTASASFTFTSTEAGSTFGCSLDGAPYTACTSPASYTNLTNATHTFAVRATDPAGNTDGSAATSTWIVNVPVGDMTPPDTTILSGPTGTVTTPDASFTFSSSEPGSTFACSLDGAAFTTCTSPASYTALANASHTFSVRATDAAGNTDASPASSTWIVNVPAGDTTPPDTTITGGPTGTVTTASASFTFSSSETGSTFACSLDGAAFLNCTSPASYSALANGSHTFSVRATDASGNTDASPATRTWTVNVPPAAPVNSQLPAISGASSQGSMLTADPGNWSGAPTSFAYQWRRCNSSGAACSDITNATGTGYLTTASDVGSTLRVNVTASNAGGSASAVSAATATIVAAAADPVIAAAGDIACDPHDSKFNGGQGTGSTCHQGATGALLGSLGNLSAILPLGDIQYDCSPVNEYAQSFGPAWGAFKSLIRPAPGNHEYRVNPDEFGLNDCSTTGAGYFSYFGASAGDPTKGYYSYDIGTWHLISLNANCTFIPCKANSVQETWLKADLAAHQNMCTLAYYHQSRFSSGGSGNLSAYAPWWTDLYAGGADVVLSAHDHDYERFAPQDPAQNSDPARGIREFIVGTGGRSHSGFHTIMPNSQVRDSTAYGLLVLTLHPTGYDWRFVPEAGKTFTDSGSGSCHA